MQLIQHFHDGSDLLYTLRSHKSMHAYGITPDQISTELLKKSSL